MVHPNEMNRKKLRMMIEMHRRYLEMYKLLNNGSLEGATPFFEFYTYWTYTIEYSTMRKFALIQYR